AIIETDLCVLISPNRVASFTVAAHSRKFKVIYDQHCLLPRIKHFGVGHLIKHSIWFTIEPLSTIGIASHNEQFFELARCALMLQEYLLHSVCFTAPRSSEAHKTETMRNATWTS